MATMGTRTFAEVRMDAIDVETAYARARESARAGRRRGGSITGTRSVTAIRDTPMTLLEADALSDGRIQDLFGSTVCEAIPLCSETVEMWENVDDLSVTVTVPAEVYNKPRMLRTAVADAAGVGADEVTSFALERGQDGKEKVSASPEVLADVTDGEMETRYVIVDPYTITWSGTATYATVDEAQTALAGYATASGKRAAVNIPLEIVGITRRVGGGPLVEATVSADWVTATFEVLTRRLVSPAVRGTGVEGWYFYGWTR